MTRTLPWMKGSNGGSSTTKAGASKAQSISHTPKRRRLSTPSLSGDDLNTTGVSTPQRKARFRQSTTPSTPPFPALPVQEPMREGYAADDSWIMVEDEFLATAKLFTQHLHHAEYQRLKKQAEEHRAGNIARPVDGRTALPVSTMREKERKQQNNNITRIEQDDADGRDPWLHDPLLGALMDSPTKPKQLLTTLAPGRLTTRAAAGFLPTAQESQNSHRSEQPRSNSDTSKRTTDTTRRGHEIGRASRAAHSDTMDEDDSDDLDKPVRKIKPVTKRETRPPSPVKRSTNAEPKAMEPSLTSGIFARYARKSPSPVRTREYHAGTDTKQIDKKPKIERDETAPHKEKMSRAEMRAALRAKSTFRFDSWAEDTMPLNKHTTPASDILAKRSSKKDKINKQDSKTATDTTETKRRPSTTIEIPTFLDL